METSARDALLSKFVIGDLALLSALQLEKARTRRMFSPEPLLKLAAALRQTTFPDSADRAVAMWPGYYEPLNRVAMERAPGSDGQVPEIGPMLDWAVSRLGELAVHEGVGAESEQVVDFCVMLHDEFVGRPAAEARFGQPGTVAASSGVG